MAIVFGYELIIFAFILGIKHSLDADHLVAVSSLITRATGIRKTSVLSAFWALGHMLTASIITGILYLLKDQFLSAYLSVFESVVAWMLILIGVLTILWEFDVISFGKHSHGHIHTGETVEVHEGHTHDQEGENLKEIEHHHFFAVKSENKIMVGIGVIHGLASNDELLILLTLTLGLNQLSEMLFGVLIFSLGVVLGMILYGTLLNASVIAVYRERITKVINLTIAVLAISYGIYILLGGSTINLFPFVNA